MRTSRDRSKRNRQSSFVPGWAVAPAVLVVLANIGLLGCQWRSAAGPTRVSAEEAKASLAQFLTDPDLLPGLVIEGDGAVTHRVETPGGSKAEEYLRFKLQVAQGPGDADGGAAWVDPASGVVTGLIVSGSAKTSCSAGRAVSRAEALNIGRRFCQRHCPAVWQKSDRVEESTSLIPLGLDVWNCMFDGEKRGFTNYISTSARILRGTGKVVDYSGTERVSLEPPEIVVPRSAAEKAARKYVGARLGVPSDSLRVMKHPMDKWMTGSDTQPGFHAAYYIVLAVMSDGGKKVAYQMTVSVDVVSGEVIREEPSPMMGKTP